MNKKFFSIMGIVLALFIVALFVYLPLSGVDEEIKSFEDCVRTGHSVMESYPRQCMANKITFVEENCQSGENILTLDDAKRIAVSGECGNRLKGNYFCNENTGTYWIDLNIEREGCSPACVISLNTRQAVINWRCTGLVEP